MKNERWIIMYDTTTGEAKSLARLSRGNVIVLMDVSKEDFTKRELKTIEKLVDVFNAQQRSK